MTRRLSRILAAFFLTSWTASVAHATPVTYTFEPPNFTLGQMTTLANVAPNIGPPAFLTSFAASPTANGFSIVGGATPPIPIFSGQFLVDTGGAIDTLLLTFNTPIFSLQVDFLLNASVTTPPSLLSLVTPVGSTSQPGANVGGPLQGGTLIFRTVGGFQRGWRSDFLRDRRSRSRHRGGHRRSGARDGRPLAQRTRSPGAPANMPDMSRYTANSQAVPK
jgi:hypothetical protein